MAIPWPLLPAAVCRALKNTLPSQAGHDGEFLSTDGTNAFWTAGGGGGTYTAGDGLQLIGTEFSVTSDVARKALTLAQFAPTTSAQLAGVISDETGTGALVFATSPTLVTPALGTPSSVTLTNATGLPVSTGVSGLGTGVATFLATPTSANLAAAVTNETGTGALVFATSPTLVTPALGTPASGVMTNVTGLPISTGVSGLGTGVAAFLATPTSANLATAVTNETGTGALVFADSSVINPTSTGATTPGSGAFTTLSNTGMQTNSAASVASFPSELNTGSIFTGGTGTTTLPHVLVQPTGATAATTWNTSGTAFGVNASSGFTGNFIDFRVNGSAAPALTVASNGAITSNGNIVSNSSVFAGSSGSLAFNTRTRLFSGADGQLAIRNNANTTNGVLTVAGVQLPASTLAVLTAAYPAATWPGMRAFVSDASVAYSGATIGTTAAGGGANFAPVYSNGTNYLIG